MLNQVVLIGKLLENPILKKDENGISFCEFDLSIRRSFKSENGKYENDFIKCSVFDNLAKKFATNAEKGTLVAIKGRLEPVNKSETNRVVVEKITYL